MSYAVVDERLHVLPRMLFTHSPCILQLFYRKSKQMNKIISHLRNFMKKRPYPPLNTAFPWIIHDKSFALPR